jgi:nucleoid-associated protein YgaU
MNLISSLLNNKTMGLMDFLKNGKKRPVPKQEQPLQEGNFFVSKQQSDQPEQQSTQQPEQAAGVNLVSQQELYKVKSGDSLSKISSRIYGDPSQWRKIYDANRDIIKNPDMIHPGQHLVIPKE